MVMGTFQQKVHADNLISESQTADGQLVATTNTDDTDKAHIDLSSRIMENGAFVDFSFPTMSQETLHDGTFDSLKVGLKGNTRYYMFGRNFHHMTITDSSGSIVYENTTSVFNEDRHMYVTVPKDDVYTIKYDEFNQSLTAVYGGGDNTASLSIFQVSDNEHPNVTVDFDKAPSGYGNFEPNTYAFVADTGGADKFYWKNKGISSDGNTSSKYSVNSLMTYYPVYGYYMTGDIGRTDASATASMDGTTISSNTVPSVGIHGYQVKLDKLYYHPDTNTHGKVESSVKTYNTMGGYGSKDQMRHLNFWQRLKSFLGDPVDTYSGAFIDNRTLMSYGGNNPLHFDINYNSVTDGGKAIGEGYTHNFDTSLVKDDDGTIHVYWSPNVVSDFNYDATTSEYTAADAKQSNIHVSKTDDGYVVDSPEDGTYTFDSDGKLLSKKDKVGQVTTYEYTNNQLTKVSNDRSQSYSFEYADGRISKVTDGTGKSISLDYASNWGDYYLWHVTFSDNKVMTINYSDTRVLNINYDGQQLISNEYDGYGRVVKQTNGDGTTADYNYDELTDPGHLITKYTVDGKTITSVHDKNGNLLSQTDQNGHTTKHSYNSNNQELSETDAKGATSTYAYDGANHVITQTDALNQSTNYLYQNNQLAGITTADNKSASFNYNDEHQLISSTDKSGLVTTYQYDKFGNPTVIEKTKDGKTYSHIENSYDDHGYLTKTDNNGQITTFTNDAQGRKISETLPGGSVVKFTYDNNNNVLTSSIGDKTTSFEYDSLGNMTKKTMPNGRIYTYTYDHQKLVSVSLHANGALTEKYSYNASGLLTSATVGDDVVAKYNYDAAGNKISATDYNGNTSTYSYDEKNQEISSTVGGATTKVSYDAAGQIVSTTSGNSNTTSNVYDEVGNLVKQTLADGTIVENTYDAMGHMLTSRLNNKTITYEYDALGNRTSVTDAAGNTTHYSYNADGQVISSTNALGHVTKYDYNENGQLVQTLNNRGEVTAKYSYDDVGNVISVSNSKRVVRTMTYDVNNNLLTVKDANGDLVKQSELNTDEQIISTINALNSKSSVAYSYNNSQTSVTVTDQLGHKQSTTTDYGGNVIKSSDDVTAGVASYDANGNLTSQSVNNGQNKTTLTYDKDQNVVSEANNDGKETYTYDALDQLSSWTNARGNTTTYARDADGNITEAKASDIDNQYTYDSNGNETGAKNSSSDISKTYDALNRVISKTQDGQTIKYVYDDREFLTDVIYPGDKKVHYDVDTDGKIAAMTDWNNHKTSYDYDKNGRVVKTSNWNGVVEERSYNTAGQVLTIKTSLYDKTLTNYKYTYDADGNLVTDNSQTYQYDTLNRLTAGKSNYSYDEIGNITAAAGHELKYDDDSRLTSVDGDATEVDADGNLTKYTMSDTTHAASYNSQNQLTKYDNLSYTYDADGNRVSAGSTKFVYDDNGHLLSDSTNTYVYGASGLVGYYNKDGKFVTYLFNQRGDVVKETDESGSVTNSFEYDDYGKLTSSDKAADSVFGYGGQYGAVTDKNGLIFLRTRYYNPEIMRFMNRDTVRGSVTDTKSLNRFAYVEGNPLTYVDPNGEAATWLKSNPLDALYAGLTVLNFVPGLNVVTSIGMMAIDLAKGDYTSLAMDSLGILIPGAAVGLKLGYDGVKILVDGLKVGGKFTGFGIRVGARVAEVVDKARAIKSAVQVTGARGASKVIAAVDRITPHIGPKLAPVGVSDVGSEAGSVAQKLQSFVDSVNSGKSKFLKTYRQSSTNAKLAPDYISPQKHHILQNEWAKKNLAKYGYDPNLAPVIMLETGKGLPHTIITNNQQSRKMVRLMNGDDKWGTSLMDELDNSRTDLRAAGISSKDIDEYMNGVMKMLKKIGVPENEYIR